MTLLKQFIFDNNLAENNIRPSVNNIVDVIYTGSSDDGPWIAGGMARALAVDNYTSKFADIDVWFKCSEQLEECKKRLIVEFSSCMWEDWNSSNAITYIIGEHKVQLIRKHFFDSISDVFDYFDFTCCQIGIDKKMQPYGPGIEDAKKFILRIAKLDPDYFLARYAKYISYGYKMNNKEFIDIINNNNINYEFDGTSGTY